ncbi:unnamed protein product [Prorocentrum cordatum]|uniref:Uncharacterized protein n=1 Tax=Prorocentrum cordatum TaxID=2364126 RepID=A0ABN9TQX8_9DINO|nr:unnamed protein product [Polarella glacialis]
MSYRALQDARILSDELAEPSVPGASPRRTLVVRLNLLTVGDRTVETRVVISAGVAAGDAFMLVSTCREARSKAAQSHRDSS